MCLAVPGRVIAIDSPDQSGSGLLTGRVDFAGTTREVCLACVPEVRVGDYVLVHAGLAINVVDEEQARITLDYLAGLDQPGLPTAGEGADASWSRATTRPASPEPGAREPSTETTRDQQAVEPGADREARSDEDPSSTPPL